MHQRCENPNNDAYDNYGGRGISVCAEWADYLVFKKWSLANGYQEGLTIDRIDVDGDYEPNNCRWTTYSVQLSNRRHYARRKSWKPVEALDADGNVIGKFDCINDAIEWLGDKTRRGTGISHALRGNQDTAYGYRWRYVNA